MPNWCEGTLKVRGTKENLMKFILEGLHPVNFLGNEEEPLKNDCGYIACESNCWIEGTFRGFVTNLDVWICDVEDIDIICLETKFAWGIDAEQLLDVCKKYNVDMKIYAFERGMEFNQDIEIINGEIIKDEEIKFDDYRWKCVCPTVGG